MGYGVSHNSRSRHIQSLRLFLDSIPKDIGDTSRDESLATILHLARRLWKNAKKELTRIHRSGALWIQRRVFVLQGTVGPFNFDAGFAKDQTGSILRVTQNLLWQVNVVVNENCDLSLLSGLSLVLWFLTYVGALSKNQTVQAQGQEKIQNA